MLTWPQLKEVLKAEFVGGDLIFRDGRIQKSLGRKVKGVFQFSPLGKKLAATLTAPPVAVQPTTRKPNPRRQNRSRKVAIDGQA